MYEITDLALIEDVKKNNSSESLVKLADRHAGIFLQIAKRYTGGTETVRFPLEDVLDQREAIIFDAIKDFDTTKGFKFQTWLGSKVKYFCLNSFKQHCRYVPVEPSVMQYIVDSRGPINSPEEHQRADLEINYVLSVLSQVQDSRIRRIINMRYFSENKKHSKFAYIARRLDMSTQGVIDLHNKFISLIRRKIKAEDNMDKI